MKKCLNCGKEIPESMTACSYCETNYNESATHPSNEKSLNKCNHCGTKNTPEAQWCENKDCRKFITSIPDGIINSSSQVIVKTYNGNQATANELYQKDALKMADQGYVPISQSWAPGAYGCGSFIIAFLLCFILIGFIIFFYMLFVKPNGALSVTYELRKDNSKILSASEEKTCPRCAEQVKLAAKVCRFCGHNFD